MVQATFVSRTFRIRKLLLICLTIISCKAPGKKETKIKQYDSLFHASMLGDTYFLEDSVITHFRNGDSTYLKMEYIYDSLLGVRELTERSIEDSFEYRHDHFFLNGKIFKLALEVIPLNIPPGKRYQTAKALYYLDGNNVIYKWERDASIVDIPKQVRIADSFAKVFNQKIKIK